MPEITEAQRLPADVDAHPLVQDAAALRPVIHAYRDELEREQRLPKALVEQFHAAGFYSMVIRARSAATRSIRAPIFASWSSCPRARAPPAGTSPITVSASSSRWA